MYHRHFHPKSSANRCKSSQIKRNPMKNIANRTQIASNRGCLSKIDTNQTQNDTNLTQSDATRTLTDATRTQIAANRCISRLINANRG